MPPCKAGEGVKTFPQQKIERLREWQRRGGGRRSMNFVIAAPATKESLDHEIITFVLVRPVDERDPSKVVLGQFAFPERRLFAPCCHLLDGGSYQSLP